MPFHPTHGRTRRARGSTYDLSHIHNRIGAGALDQASRRRQQVETEETVMNTNTGDAVDRDRTEWPSARRRAVWTAGRVASACGLALTAALGVTGTANAAEPCAGQACLYDREGNPIGSYQVSTDQWQEFTRFRTATAVNGFEDSAVYFLNRNGTTGCIQPRRTASTSTAGGNVPVAIMIRAGGNCYPGGQIQ